MGFKCMLVLVPREAFLIVYQSTWNKHATQKHTSITFASNKFHKTKHIISVDISYRYICTLSVLLHFPRSTPSSFSKYSMSIPSTSSSPLTAWHHVLLRLLAHSWWPPLPPPIGNLITKIYSSMMSKSCNMHCFSELSFCGNVTHSTRHPYISGWLNFAWHSNNLHVLYHCASVNLLRASPHPPLS